VPKAVERGLHDHQPRYELGSAGRDRERDVATRAPADDRGRNADVLQHADQVACVHAMVADRSVFRPAVAAAVVAEDAPQLSQLGRDPVPRRGVRR